MVRFGLEISLYTLTQVVWFSRMYIGGPGVVPMVDD